MEDFRTLLINEAGTRVDDEDQGLLHRLVEVAWNALHDGGDAATVRDAIMAEANTVLEEAESALANAEHVIQRN